MKVLIYLFSLLGVTYSKLLRAQSIDFGTHGTDWSTCEGKKDILQSPIDLDGDGTAPPGTVRDGQFHIDYQPLAEVSLLNDGSTLRFVIKSNATTNNSTLHVESFGSSGGDMHWSPERTIYTLKYMDIRGAAEHTFRGKRFPVEVQLVHENEEVGIPIIVSLFYGCKMGCNVEGPPSRYAPKDRSKIKLSFLNREQTQEKEQQQVTIEESPDEMDGEAIKFLYGDKEKKIIPSFTNLMDALKEMPEVGKDTELKFDPPIDLNAMMSDFDFFLYAGSTTLPPCSPASWLIQNGHFDADRHAIKSAFSSLKKLSKGFGNFRYVHAIYDRPILLMSPVLPKVETLEPPAPRRYKDPGIVEANKLSNETMTYAQNLDARLKSAAEQRLAVWNEPPGPLPSNFTVRDFFNTMNMQPSTPGQAAIKALNITGSMGKDLISRMERATNATIRGLNLEPPVTTPKPKVAPKHVMTKDELYKRLVSYAKRDIGNMVSNMTNEIFELGKGTLEKKMKAQKPGPP